MKNYFFLPQEIVKDFNKTGEGPKKLDFTGCEQLTDEVLFALRKNGQLKRVISLLFTGCAYITDLGLSYLGNIFPDLREVGDKKKVPDSLTYEYC